MEITWKKFVHDLQHFFQGTFVVLWLVTLLNLEERDLRPYTVPAHFLLVVSVGVEYFFRQRVPVPEWLKFLVGCLWFLRVVILLWLYFWVALSGMSFA